ncbi:MAG: DUF2341 domain-containing protein [Candidatus Aenigmatarchaeota archaeon]
MSFSNKNSSLKKLISTYVATVILVVLTIGIGVTLYLYFSGYVSYLETKTEETSPIKSIIECSKARIDFYYRVKGIQKNYTMPISNESLKFENQTQIQTLWLSGWNYRTPITINNTQNSNTLTDYQVLVTINTKKLIEGEGIYELPIYISSVGTELTDYQIKINITNTSILEKISDDGRDIRFFNRSTDNPYSDTNGLLPYWIEEIIPNQRLVVWVKVPNITASGGTTIYLYYGNPNANSMSNGDLVFEFFDDFDNLNTSIWATSGSVSINEGIVILDRTTTDARLYSLNRLYSSKPFITEVKYQHPSVYRNRLYLTTSQNGGSPTSYDYGIFSPSIYWNGYTGITLATNTWYIVRWEDTTTNYIWRILDMNYNEIISRNHGSPISNTGYISFSGTEDSSSDFRLDWIRVRKYTSPEPTVNIGSERIITQISSGERMRNDCGDIRFTDSDGRNLNYWIESGCNSTNTKIWVKVPNITANSNKIIYLYYGNPNASSESNPHNTLVFYDDFESGQIDSNKWDIKQSVGSVDIRTDVRFGTYSIGSDQGPWQGLGEYIYDQNHFFLKLPDGPNVKYKVINYAIRWKTTYYWGHFCGFGFGGTAEAYFIPYDNVWRLYESIIERINSSTINVTVFENGVNKGTWSFTIPQSTIITYGIQTRHNGAGDNSIYVRGDNFIVRKYTSPEPTISIGNEEIPTNITTSITLIINSPLNTTYYSSSIPLNISAISYNSSALITVYLNNQEIYQTNLQSNTWLNISQTLTNLNIGTYSLTVIINNSYGLQVIGNVTFKIEEQPEEQGILLSLVNIGSIDLGNKYLIKFLYDNNKIETRNITVQNQLKIGDFLEIPLKDLPKGKIKKIEVYCLDVCPGLLIGIKSVNIEV